MKIYQLYQITTGLRFCSCRAESEEEAIDYWLFNFLSDEVLRLSEQEADVWLDELVGLNLEKLGCQGYEIREYIDKYGIDLNTATFAIYKGINAKSEYHRETVCGSLQLVDEKNWSNYVSDSFGESSLVYLDELIKVSCFDYIVKYLTNSDTKGLYVGGNYSDYAFELLKAENWLSWYNYVKGEISENEFNQCPFYDEMGSYIHYPFLGEDIYPDKIKKRSMQYV
ncbi:MAG: hypothetical protein RLN90_08655 [Balneolaceae bacterium]